MLNDDLSAPLPPRWEGSIVDRVATHAGRAPDRAAVVGDLRTWTYGELQVESDRLARRLLELAPAPGARIAVVGHRSPNLVPALLGVWKSGGAFTVLDPSHPPAWQRDVLEAVGPAALVEVEPEAPGWWTEWLERRAVPTIRVSVDDGALATGPLPAATPDSPATIFFTSGTAARPRGVVASQRPVSHFLDWYHGNFDLGESDRFGLLAGVSHDPMVRDVFAPLWIGASLRVPRASTVADPRSLLAWLRRERVTVCHIGPAVGRGLGALLPPHASGRAKPAGSLRYVFFHGDVVRRRDLLTAARWAPGARCVAFYGATETPQAVAWCEPPRLQGPIDPGSGSAAKPLPLGEAVEGMQLAILDASARAAAVGTTGEVCVRSPYLALGYLDDDGLTADRFVPNPLTQRPDDRIYRTGDRGRRRDDGSIELHGRFDREVKVAGYRVSLDEVERAALECREVEDVRVIAEPAGELEVELVAFVRAASAAAGARLRQALANRQPGKAVPGRIVVVRELPTTPNGKVDTSALRELAAQGSS